MTDFSTIRYYTLIRYGPRFVIAGCHQTFPEAEEYAQGEHDARWKRTEGKAGAKPRTHIVKIIRTIETVAE